MRLWAKLDTRRPSPQPAQTDDRKPFMVGTLAWAVALVFTIVARTVLQESGLDLWVATCTAGTGFGIVGFAYALVRLRRSHTATPD
jgi:hypothetical protein